MANYNTRQYVVTKCSDQVVIKMDTLGIEPKAFRTSSGCATSTPYAPLPCMSLATYVLADVCICLILPLRGCAHIGWWWRAGRQAPTKQVHHLCHTDWLQPYVGRFLFYRAHVVVVSHPLSMREALGSIPSVSTEYVDLISSLLVTCNTWHGERWKLGKCVPSGGRRTGTDE